MRGALLRNQELVIGGIWCVSSSIPDFLARNRYFLARKYTVNGFIVRKIHRAEKSTERAENSTVQ